MLDKAQIANLQTLFGADFAISQLEAEYQAALQAGAETLSTKIQDLTTAAAEKDGKITALETKVTELEAKTQGLADPLEGDEQREDPPEDDPDGEQAVKPIPEAHAELVAGGMEPKEAWAKLRTERSDDYAEHFGG